MRKLASIRRITDIKPIENADAIVCAYVDGWPVVIKLDEFKVGDLVVYCEIDSWIPHTLAPFLSKGKEPRVYEGIEGERLRTVKLRGQVSQGLIMPISILGDTVITEHDDVSEILNVVKYEKPLPACLSGMAKGNFPSFVPKTDEERCVSGDTLIITNHGTMTMETLVSRWDTTYVLTYNHEHGIEQFKKITGVSVVSNEETWYKLSLKSGKHLFCTHNHKIWCDDTKTYIEADKLCVGSRVMTNVK